MSVDVLVLGPVRACRDGNDVPLGGPRERGTLAALALAGPAGLDTGRLVDLVWGEAVPRTAARTVQAYLSRLRATLGPDAVVSASGRHRLSAAVDLWRFESLVARAREVPEEARQALTEALALWCEQAPAGGAALDGAAVELASLGKAREEAEVLLLEHLDDAAVVAAAERLVMRVPHREDVWLTLAAALYRLGRHTEALDALRRAKSHLANELGLDPSPALARLEHDVLNHRVAGAGTGVPPPLPPLDLIGRDDLVDGILDRLATRRLVTLIGPGGIGKTSVGVVTAHAFRRRLGAPVLFAALSGAATTAAAQDTLLAAIGAEHEDDIASAFGARFTRATALVVLDNCEHVLPALARILDQVLARTRHVRFLATSRSPLGIAGESVVDVPPLESSGPALALLRARAQDAGAAIAPTEHATRDCVAICRALDGIPLAIEVAARQLRYTSLQDLRAELTAWSEDTNGPTLPGGPLAATLDTSMGQLSDDERRAYAVLGMLNGSVPLASAAAIVGGQNLVTPLVDASLVVADADGIRMYGPVRQHALANLRDEDRRVGRQAIALELTTLAQRASQQLIGPDELQWISLMDHVHADVRGVLEWAAARHDLARVAEVAARVGYLWLLGWGVREGHAWLQIARTAEVADDVRAQVLVWSSLIALRRGDHDTARTCAADAIRLARALGDDRLLGDALHALAQPDKYGPAADNARAALKEAIEVRRRSGDLAGAAMSIGALADTAMNVGDLDGAAEGYALGLPLMRASGSDRGLLSFLHSMSELAVMRGEDARADELVAEAMPLALRTGDVWHQALLAIVASTAARDARRAWPELRDVATRALEACSRQTDPVVTLEGIEAVGGILLDAGEPHTALRLLRGAREMRAARHLPVAAERKARRDRDERRAEALCTLPRSPAAPDLDGLLAVAEGAIRR